MLSQALSVLDARLTATEDKIATLESQHVTQVYSSEQVSAKPLSRFFLLTSAYRMKESRSVNYQLESKSIRADPVPYEEPPVEVGTEDEQQQEEQPVEEHDHVSEDDEEPEEPLVDIPRKTVSSSSSSQHFQSRKAAPSPQPPITKQPTQESVQPASWVSGPENVDYTTQDEEEV